MERIKTLPRLKALAIYGAEGKLRVSFPRERASKRQRGRPGIFRTSSREQGPGWFSALHVTPSTTKAS